MDLTKYNGYRIRTSKLKTLYVPSRIVTASECPNDIQRVDSAEWGLDCAALGGIGL